MRGSASPFGRKNALCWKILPELSRATMRRFFAIAVDPSASVLMTSVWTIAVNGAPVKGRIEML
jgi:hypothetical protein